VDTKVAGPNQYLYILINVLQRCSAIVLGEHPLPADTDADSRLEEDWNVVLRPGVAW
jgi:hypothetical protein